MTAQRKYPEELRERAVKMVAEIRERDGKGHGEIARVGRQLGVHPEALRSWLQQAEVDDGKRPGTRATARTSRHHEVAGQRARIGPDGQRNRSHPFRPWIFGPCPWIFRPQN